MLTLLSKTSDDIVELLHDAKHHIYIAMDYKEECPVIASAMVDVANSLLAQAEKLYMALKETIERKEHDEKVEEMWHYEKKKYLEKVEKVKSKLSMYSKM